MPSLDKLLNLFDCEDPVVWSNKVFSLASDHGFEYALYGLMQSKVTALSAAFIKSNYDMQWRQTYDNMQFYDVDPVVLHCLSSTMPITWSATSFHGKHQQEFYEQASGYGLRAGISYPVHGASGEFGMLSFVSPYQDFFTGHAKFEALKSLSMIRDYVLESSIRFLRSDDNSVQTRLTPRELECLKWVMLGKSSWEISMILHCSEATINFHVANLKRKFNVQTRQQAVVKAIKERLIVPA
jgi:LuxR family quorum-sensing transcriptional regulator LasR